MQDVNILHGVKTIMTNQTGSHVHLQKSSRLGIIYPHAVRSDPLCRCVITCAGFEELALLKAAAILFSRVSIAR